MVSADGDRRTDAPRVVETIETTRQLTPDGHVVVTRWVQVSSFDEGGRRAGFGDGMTALPVQQVRPYAAVPVQGGWLVFQL